MEVYGRDVGMEGVGEEENLGYIISWESYLMCVCVCILGMDVAL